MLTRDFKIIFIINLLAITLNLYCSKEIQTYMNKSEKDKACYIYGLDIPNHLQFLTNLEHDKDDKINDEIDLVLNLLIKKFVAINGPENIVSFLENRKLLSENINSRLKNLLKEKHEYKEDLERLNYEQLVPKEFFNYAYFGVLGPMLMEAIFI